MAALTGKAVALGSPPTSLHRVSQVDLADWMTEIEAGMAAAGFSVIAASYAALAAVSGISDGAHGWVISSTPEAGVYRRQYGVWTYVAALPAVMTESLAAQQAQADRLLAEAARVAAVQSAASAAASATAADGSADAADLARSAAQSAAIASGSRIYATTSAGLAGTTNGSVFQVLNAPGVDVYQNSAGVATLLGRIRAVDTRQNAMMFGLSTSASAATNAAAMVAAAVWSSSNGGAAVVVPAGTYAANDLDTLDPKKFEFDRGSSMTSVVPGDALIRNRDGSVIGLQYNHREQRMWTGAYPRNVSGAQIITGSLVDPPATAAGPVQGLDVIAHWYGNWGLDWLRQQTGISTPEFDQYYDWSWNKGGAYSAERHPVLGWYRQDDPQVLKWMAHWLIQAGVRGVCPVSFEMDISTWHLPTSQDYWIYRLFNNVPEFKRLAYIPWVQSTRWADQPYSVTPTEAQLAAQWDSIIFGLTDTYRNHYVVHHLGRRWLALYCWDSQWLLSTIFGGDVNALIAWLTARATAAKTRFYDGIALFSHNAVSEGTMSRATLRDAGVLYYHSPYSGPWGSPSATTYTEVVQQLVIPSGTIPCANTSLLSVAPVPVGSRFNLPGHTPGYFREYVAKCARDVMQRQDKPNLIFAGTVGEHTESGPGLVPNMASGWSYLDAIREAVVAEGVDGNTLETSIPLTLANGWVDYGPSDEPARVTKDADNQVIVSGTIKSGTVTAGTLIAQLPVGYRPAKAMLFAVAISGGAASIRIAPNGDITAQSALSSAYTSLSGIFRAA